MIPISNNITAMPAPPPAAPGIRLSPSQVSTLQTCAARWYYKHALRLPELVSPQLLIGRAVGAAAAAAVHDPDTAIAAMQQEWQQGLLQIKPALPAAAEAKYRERAAGLLHVWCEQGAHLVGGPGAETELQLSGQIGGVRVKARADIMCADGRVIELKTTSAQPRELPARYYLQAVTYAMLAGAQHIQVAILAGTRTLSLRTHDRRLTTNATQYAETAYAMAADTIAAAVFPPRRDAEFCSRSCCTYYLHCIRDHGGEVRP